MAEAIFESQARPGRLGYISASNNRHCPRSGTRRPGEVPLIWTPCCAWPRSEAMFESSNEFVLSAIVVLLGGVLTCLSENGLVAGRQSSCCCMFGTLFLDFSIPVTC